MLFNYKGKTIRVYEFSIAGQPMVGLTCDSLTEYVLVKEIKAIGYPYLSLTEFSQCLIAAGLIDKQPVRDELIEQAVSDDLAKQSGMQ